MESNMSKLSWNIYNKKYVSPLGFSSAVSPALKGGPHFDSKHKKLPTPYGLFQEWASIFFTGDWTSIKINGGFIVCVNSQTDDALIRQKFGVIGVPIKSTACANLVRMNYKDSDYKALAKFIGYQL